MKQFVFIFIILSLAFVVKAQPPVCNLKQPEVTINFGAGNVADVNTRSLYDYERIPWSCPPDGYYSFGPYTSGCFNDDWHAILEDHTAGDTDGNMLLVNAAPYGGVFLSIPINGLKSNTQYELGLWLINLCRPTLQCESILLPKITIRLETPEGKLVSMFTTQFLQRIQAPQWGQHRATFTTPANSSTLQLVMADNEPGGCGNDFALDDITFRECVIQTIEPDPPPKPKPVTKKATTSKPSVKKTVPQQQEKIEAKPLITPDKDTTSRTIADVKQPLKIFPLAPPILKTRENALVRRIEADAGKINIKIYDNGEIDGDTVSIYHNNVLIRSHKGLSQQPITIEIDIDPSQPHHELIMVAENLGSIPPNTSVMIITTASNRYEVYISSSEQKNAKVVFDLKK